METDIIVALIGLLGIAIAGIFGILQAQLQRRLRKVEKQSNNNSQLTIENNILEQLIPTLEKKDDALDKIAEILDQFSRRLEYLEMEQKNILRFSQEKCMAPKLIDELHRVCADEEREEVKQNTISAFLNEESIHKSL